MNKKSSLILFISIISFATLITAAGKPFIYNGITFDLSQKETLKIAGKSANCVTIDKQSVICGNYKDASLRLIYKDDKLEEITVKTDITDVNKTFARKLTELTEVYGKPTKINLSKKSAIFNKDSSQAAIWLRDNGILLYYMCKKSGCKSISEIEI
ncbi:MAG: hypothetical protein PF637_14255 [Spirochaetes bacterium]|jgi:hypothetical protein|nr:hypothetical protein [Spirochaetota bacterium]